MYSYSPGDLQGFSPGPSHGMRRGALVLLLCALLGIAGAITYTAYASNTVTTQIPVRQPVAASVPTAQKQPVSRAKTLSAIVTTKTTARTTQPIHTTKVTAHPTHTPVAGSKPTTTSSPLPISSNPIYYGNTSLREVALTFDDGPNPYYTAQILSVLQQYDVKATFFDVGYLVQDYPAIVEAEYDQGHIVADHSWSHPDLTRMSIDGVHSQLSAAAQAIHSAIGVYPTFFRPPYGNYNADVIQQAIALNLNTVMWNDDPRDWSLPGTGMIIDRALGEAHNGSIILLHDGGGNRWQTVAALPTIITMLRARGYRLVTLQQLLQDMSAPAHAQFTLNGKTLQEAAVRSRHPQSHLPPPPPHWSLPARLALEQ